MAAPGEPEVADLFIFTNDRGAPGKKGRVRGWNALDANERSVFFIYPGASLQQVLALGSWRQFEHITYSACTGFLSGQTYGIVFGIHQRVPPGFSTAHLTFLAQQPIENPRLQHCRPASGDHRERLALPFLIDGLDRHFRRFDKTANLERVVLRYGVARQPALTPRLGLIQSADRSLLGRRVSDKSSREKKRE